MIVVAQEALTQAVHELCDLSDRDRHALRELSERMTREHHVILDVVDEMRGIDTRDVTDEPQDGPAVH